VEKYLIEIAKNYNIAYEPDPQVMREERKSSLDGILIDLSDRNNLDGGTSGPPQPGFIGYPQPPPLPQMPQLPNTVPFQYPKPGPSGGGSGNGGISTSYTPASAPAFNYNIPPNPSASIGGITDEKKDLNINQNFLREERNENQPPPYDSLSPDEVRQGYSKAAQMCYLCLSSTHLFSTIFREI
jgi:vacuolar protein sorting-associated protein IST1